MAAIANQGEFEAKFREHIQDMKARGPNMPYEEAAQRLRTLIKSGILRHTDIGKNPSRFLAAHRLLAELATALGPGFWIRFTVHFNLFAGTVVALGSPEQVKILDELQEKGKIGCFGLTEAFAGVNSGLVVNTTATYDHERKEFVLQCPDRGAFKNWISQGLCADYCLVVATLKLNGKSLGPHAFLMEIRRDGKLVEGVEMGDMGVKTIGNDLDNAWISFQNARIPKSALLSRYGYIDEQGQYVQAQKGIRTMDMIGQRLYTGRTVIARSSLVFTRCLYASTRQYSDNKMCWAPKGAGIPLSEIPQLKSLYKEAEAKLQHLESFCDKIDERLSECLVKQQIPPDELVQAIASAKVRNVETAIDLCWRLKQEVGSFALMSGSGFEQMDYLQCCKFAEGDSRILMQKITRDSMKTFSKGGSSGSRPAQEVELMKQIQAAGKSGDIDAEHRSVYQLAACVIDRTIESFVPSPKL
mmetsp:Transcript_31467/g.67577  ORF Transcript_31467/g.67577 Transcript_31467/m.67577 type:complete len:471 (-) Transcript_31467:1344-2756(-)|eukprot:CAMPEP_0206451490 /NCGR_PEP_ID=MMETSP0324_2-20121206/19372_1 /ASSEMBLY_ACC=CAM_ASM_000836 /TAXON_ID=2866 /ORGANISM="Crypthecodinium cohnii, Strain Seligo" /LENGTH=470 /DNA_ID=CAMNT_0053921381 /DNA_START=74 /DNA_END=1486 /DNA_ORIENTATION=+